MDLWYPNADRSETFAGCGGHVFSPYRGVLHTTEGASASGALGAYRSTGNYPHFTVDGNTVYQHCPLNVGATALEHRAGTIDTNRASAVQIEIVGFAASPPVPATLAPLMRWIEAQTGIQFAHPVFAGDGAAVRLTDDQWRSFDGWCGHQHVPNQAHWDPGTLNIAALAPSQPMPAVTPLADPLGEIDVQLSKIPVSVPVGGDGNGWAPSQLDFAKVFSAAFNGPYPPVDGYLPIPRIGIQQRGPQTIVTVAGGAPNTSVIVWLTAAA